MYSHCVAANVLTVPIEGQIDLFESTEETDI